PRGRPVRPRRPCSGGQRPTRRLPFVCRPPPQRPPAWPHRRRSPKAGLGPDHRRGLLCATTHELSSFPSHRCGSLFASSQRLSAVVEFRSPVNETPAGIGRRVHEGEISKLKAPAETSPPSVPFQADRRKLRRRRHPLLRRFILTLRNESSGKCLKFLIRDSCNNAAAARDRAGRIALRPVLS